MTSGDRNDAGPNADCMGPAGSSPAITRVRIAVRREAANDVMTSTDKLSLSVAPRGCRDDIRCYVKLAARPLRCSYVPHH